METFDFLCGTGLAASGVLATGGYGVIALTPAEFRIARFCFKLAAFIAIALVISWGVFTLSDSRPIRLVIVGSLSGLIAMGLSETLRWVARREAKQTTESLGETIHRETINQAAQGANIEVSNVTNFKTSNNITLGPGKLIRAEGGKNIVVEGNFVDMADRQSVSLDDYLDADVGKLTDTELRSTIIDFANSMRDFEQKYKEERDGILLSSPNASTEAERKALGEAKNRSFSESSNKKQAMFNRVFRGKMLALLADAARRTNSEKDMKKYSILIAYRSFAGSDAIGEAAEQLERVGRRLPSH